MTTSLVIALVAVLLFLLALTWLALRHENADEEERRRTAEDRLRARELRGIRRRERDEDDAA